MSEPENVLARWSRLKRQSKSQGQAAAEAASGPPASPAQEGEAEALEMPAPPFDVASLPRIESIVAGSDVRAFLQKGVPAELTRAALRRAWSSDPAIRDFIEIAENQWDFANPETIPGFGSLGPWDEVQGLLAQALQQRELAGEGQARDVAASSPGDSAGSNAEGTASVESDKDRKARLSDPEPSRALQHNDTATANIAAPARRRRTHGGALPT